MEDRRPVQDVTVDPPHRSSPTRRKGTRQGTGFAYVLLAPTIFFVVALFITALLILLEYSFHAVQFGADDATGTIQTWKEFVGSSYRWQVVVTTLKVAALATIITVAIAVPTGYGLSRLDNRIWRNIGLFVVFAPLLTSVVARVYGWSLLLGDQGLLGWLSSAIGLGAVDLLYSEAAVIIALVHIFLPFAVFPVMTSLSQFDWALTDAANDLGASRWRTLLHVTMPVIAPGIIAGAQIVFALSMSSFVTPAVLGGGRVAVLATEVYDDVNNVEWPMAAVTSFVLLILAVLALAVFNLMQRAARRGEVGESVALPLSQGIRWGMRVWLAGLYLVILAPLVIIVISSLSSDASGAWPPSGLSFKWYERLLTNDGLYAALGQSLWIASTATVLSVVVGTLGSIAFHRHRTKATSALATEALAPMVVPKVTLGLAAFLMFHQLGVLKGVIGIVLMHVVITLPFVFILMSAALARVDKNLERAALDLGATRFQAFRFGTLPSVRPAMIAAALFVFIVSFDELDMTIFMLDPGRQTLPTWMFIYMQKYQDPTVAALATLMIVGCLVIVAAGALIMKLTSSRGTSPLEQKPKP